MLSEGDEWPGYSVSVAGDNRKYHVKRDRQHTGQWNVAVKVREGAGNYWQHERWIFSRAVPEDLVAAVNRVARRFHGQRGGSFYVNEYHQVLKPIFSDDEVTLHYVGEFPDGKFMFPLDDGRWTVGPAATEPPAGLTPGEDWPGPRCGIPHWITRARSKIYRPRVQWFESDFVKEETREYLDDYSSDYERLSQAIASAKGGSGGRFYVNGSGSIFTPYPRGRRRWGYKYVGRLWELIGRNDWFPKTTG